MRYYLCTAQCPDISVAEGSVSVFKDHEAACITTYGAETHMSFAPMEGVVQLYSITTNGEVVVFRRKEMSIGDNKGGRQSEESFQWVSLICGNVVVKFMAKDDEDVQRNKLEIAFKVLKAFCPDVDIGEKDGNTDAVEPSLDVVQLQQQTNRMSIIAIAEKELTRIYGNGVLKQRPWHIEEFDGRYIIHGSFPEPGSEIILGGTAEIEIGKNGEIIRYKHYK